MEEIHQARRKDLGKGATSRAPYCLYLHCECAFDRRDGTQPVCKDRGI
jgi:hypothetical protein